ncbi:immunoglobulin gamma-1 heavy chain-like [Monodelphis domestica]|uniref:immunoglobulin gamma-1 heavy chain-like n=1 Tax=Monodelphis domestica TaxID=13616 RepID=UPI0024E212E1|nr:immunoglobulin gamma-1 heavy chain-like [Monodelphis domestica]
MTLLLCLLLLSLSGFQATPPPSLFQPQISVFSGQGNPQILCQVLGTPAGAHVLSWYQQLPGKGPTFLLSQREGASPSYGPGVAPRFLAELDPEENSARLTVGNARPADTGIYYCALWNAGQYIFGEGTQFLYRAEKLPPAPLFPQLSVLTSGPGSPVLCVAQGHHAGSPRLSWTLGGQLRKGGAVESLLEDMDNAVVSILHLPSRALGGTVTCQARPEGPSLAAMLRLPPEEHGYLDQWAHGEACSGVQEDQDALARLEWMLTVAGRCYLALLGGAQLWVLLLLLSLRARRRPGLSAGGRGGSSSPPLLSAFPSLPPLCSPFCTQNSL